MLGLQVVNDRHLRDTIGAIAKRHIDVPLPFLPFLLLLCQ